MKPWKTMFYHGLLNKNTISLLEPKLIKIIFDEPPKNSDMVLLFNVKAIKIKKKK